MTSSNSCLDKIRQFDTPTVANALELLDPTRDRLSGIMAQRIKAVFHDQEPIIGHAATLMCSTRHPATSATKQVSWEDYWSYVVSVEPPRISVVQDIDHAPSAGSLWGEVQANIHLALGCVGVIIEGAIRDLPPMHSLDYGCFARDVTVGHAHSRVVDAGNSVEAGDVLINSGAVVFADIHGVIVLPQKHILALPDACQRIVDMEAPLIAFCKDSANVSLGGLSDAYRKFAAEFPEGSPSLTI